eukprot:scaffold26830_cov17-Tisochrysis_lutea.AAC.1
MRSRGWRGGNREHSASASVTSPASKGRHTIQFLPGRPCPSWPKNQVEGLQGAEMRSLSLSFQGCH